MCRLSEGQFFIASYISLSVIFIEPKINIYILCCCHSVIFNFRQIGLTTTFLINLMENFIIQNRMILMPLLAGRDC
jgi:hypothetical protein